MARIAFFALVLTMAPPASEPTTFLALKKLTANDDERRQATRFDAFARDRRPALGERLKAAAAARRLLDDKKRELSRAWILEAHLQGLSGAPSLRGKAFERARAAAADAGMQELPRHLDDVMKGEAVVRRLEELVMRRERAREPTPLTGAESNLALEVKGALSSWKAIKDERAHGHARFWLARLAATTPDGKEAAQRELQDLVRVGGNDRDTAPLRAEVRRARARLLEQAGDLANAAHEMLVADRISVVPAGLPLFEPAPKTRYGRTRETSELCFRAYQQGTSCADIERQSFDGRSFYDFSREATASVFDEGRAQIAAIEYGPLITDCIKQAGSDVVDTEIVLEWSIGYDGKVTQYQVNPRRLRKTQFDACLKEAFAAFRYQPYRGEMKHMGMNFTVGE